MTAAGSQVERRDLEEARRVAAAVAGAFSAKVVGQPQLRETMLIALLARLNGRSKSRQTSSKFRVRSPGYFNVSSITFAAIQREVDMTNAGKEETSESQRVDRGPGSHNTGSDEPADGVERPAGTVDEDANPPLSDPNDNTVDGGTGTIPPQDTGAAIPPYEGRQTGAKDNA